MKLHRIALHGVFIGAMLIHIVGAAVSAPTGNRSSDAPPDPQETFRFIEEKAECIAVMSAIGQRGLTIPRHYDALHYTIHLVPDFVTETLEGSVEMQAVSTIDGLLEVAMDMGDGIGVIEVVSGSGSPLEFSHEAGVLTIQLEQPVNTGEDFAVTIRYAGTPPRWTFTFASHNGVPVFATMSEPEGAREWWPCNDVPWDKATSTLLATVPDWMFVASNGLLTADVDNGDGTRTVTWTHTYPIATYLVSAAGTNYETVMFHYPPAG